MNEKIILFEPFESVNFEPSETESTEVFNISFEKLIKTVIIASRLPFSKKLYKSTARKLLWYPNVKFDIHLIIF